MKPSKSVRAENFPIFLYSGFRSSSTWFWSKFRAHKELLCYYEPFNEQLGSLTLKNVAEACPEGWRSHHPDCGPYSLEYALMLGDEGGVPGFPTVRNLGDRYIGTAGAEGPLDEDIAAYVQGLIKHAEHRGRLPLLSCTRILARARGLRMAFGGYHVLLIRNLFHQWNSYAGQARFGNWYFLHTLYETIELADRDPAMAQLAGIFSADDRATFEAWVSSENFDRVFCYCVGFHLYFLTLARRSADLVVDVNALAAPDGEHLEQVVAQIRQNIGINVDLTDVCTQVDFPLRPLSDKAACVETIDAMALTIKTICNASTDERIFIDGLVSDVWCAQDSFQREASSAFEYCTLLEKKAEALAIESATKVCDLDKELQEVRTALEARESELEETRQESARERADLLCRLSAREAEFGDLEHSLFRERAERSQHQVEVDREMQQLADQLARSRREMLSVQNVLGEAHEALNASQTELVVERGRAQRFEDAVVMLEAAMSNLGAVNLELAGRISNLEQAGAELAMNLAAEQAARVRSEDRLQGVLEGDKVRDRLTFALATLIKFSSLRLLMPKRVWERRLRESLCGLPGFENTCELGEKGNTPDGLAEWIWRAIISDQ
ncbi:hypothetical protein OIK40_03885 [Erythrobacter sp. sf7]|uniref:Uncharacterized protein n=1 Tax=Erythrobacter fulvus TaxID=2987523 RepID=A0ABT5JMQ6_9SPHN|nr:hypothetical protein [Erythrobacter fulvus]MDC8753779.1 hypothetical protein [Erythrobacter fulvus]